MIKRESKRTDDMQCANAVDHGAVMGKIVRVSKIIPKKQRLNNAYNLVILSVMRV